jgi:lysophospholipase L1-like esterase
MRRAGALAAALLTLTAGAFAAGVAQPAPRDYYLALGDSMAYGIQPTKAAKGLPPNGFDTGYVDVFAARLRTLAPGIRVVNYGCPGESTVTFTKGGCPWLAEKRRLHDAFRGSQLAAALAFLRAHPGEVSPITVTLWGNDFFPLVDACKGDPACVQKRMGSIASRLGSILTRLRQAAPEADIVVTGAWNPGDADFGQTDPVFRALDGQIRRAAAPAKARVADMRSVFNIGGTPTARRARICSLTFACKGGDPHPTDAGYRAMAKAFLGASGYAAKP